MSKNILALIILLAIATAIFAIESEAQAHDHAKPELDSWFKSLWSEEGGSCCEGFEAVAVDDPDWRSKDGHYQVMLYGEWLDVPDKAIVQQPNRDGRTMVWPGAVVNGVQTVRCFMRGLEG